MWVMKSNYSITAITDPNYGISANVAKAGPGLHISDLATIQSTSGRAGVFQPNKQKMLRKNCHKKIKYVKISVFTTV